jgi:hypothetical protein
MDNKTRKPKRHNAIKKRRMVGGFDIYIRINTAMVEEYMIRKYSAFFPSGTKLTLVGYGVAMITNTSRFFAKNHSVERISVFRYQDDRGAYKFVIIRCHEPTGCFAMEDCATTLVLDPSSLAEEDAYREDILKKNVSAMFGPAGPDSLTYSTFTFPNIIEPENNYRLVLCNQVSTLSPTIGPTTPNNICELFNYIVNNRTNNVNLGLLHEVKHPDVTRDVVVSSDSAAKTGLGGLGFSGFG